MFKSMFFFGFMDIANRIGKDGQSDDKLMECYVIIEWHLKWRATFIRQQFDLL